MDNNKPLKLEQQMTIKSVHQGDKEGILIIQGSASVYRSPEGFIQPDRDNELVNLDFMDLESYKKNPILVVAHQWDRPIGKITSIENRNGVLAVTAEVHLLTGEENIFEAVEKGLIKSFSIGFVPHEFMIRELHDGDVVEITSSTLVEISLMPVQSNQEALFDVIASKGVGSKLSVSAEAMARQNGMTREQLKERINLEKGLSMENVVTKEVIEDGAAVLDTPEIKTEPVIEKAAVEVKTEPVAEVETEPKTEVKAEPEVKATEEVKTFDEQALVNAIVIADETKERLLREKDEKRILDEKEAQVKAQADKETRIAEAFAYIKETQEAIINIPNDDFDADKVADFYELVSGAAEAIETKVGDIIIGSTKTGEEPAPE